MEEISTNIKFLLTQIMGVIKSYEKTSKITGENFNVFEILGLTTNEVRTHSAFIAELLNPNGTHEKGNVFILEFHDILNKKLKVDQNAILYDPKKAKVTEVEYWLGSKTETHGGYMDILLTDSANEHIIIENKIHAVDQENQLLRYHNSFKTALLVYLTLNGDSPKPVSTNNNNEVKANLICISYRKDIIEWLENCKKHTVDHPILRESITQYIYLLKKLTKQSMNEEMKVEIINQIVENSSFIESSQRVYDLWTDVQIEIIKRLVNEIKKLEFEEELKVGIEKKSEGQYIGDTDTQITLSKGEWCFHISIYFPKALEKMLIGVICDQSSKDYSENIETSLKTHFKDFKGKQLSDDNWVWVSNFDEWDTVWWSDVINSFPNVIKKKTNEILRKLKEFETN